MPPWSPSSRIRFPSAADAAAAAGDARIILLLGRSWDELEAFALERFPRTLPPGCNRIAMWRA